MTGEPTPDPFYLLADSAPCIVKFSFCLYGEVGWPDCGDFGPSNRDLAGKPSQLASSYKHSANKARHEPSKLKKASNSS